MSSDNQYTALGPAIVGFQTNSTEISTGADITGLVRGIIGRCDNGVAVTGAGANQIGVAGGSDNSFGVFGSSVNDDGVFGQSTGKNGVHGESDSPTGSGVFGENKSGGDGVFGQSTGKNGVHGESDSPTGNGVFGENKSGGDGMLGHSAGKNGVHGVSDSPTGSGVFGENTSTGDGVFGLGATAVHGRSSAHTTLGNHTLGIGVLGTTNPNEHAAETLPKGFFGYMGVVGYGGDPTVAEEDAAGVGVWGMSNLASGVIGQSRTNYGVQGISGPGGTVANWPGGLQINVGVYGASANTVDQGIAVGVQARSAADGAEAASIGVFASTSSNGKDSGVIGVVGVASSSDPGSQTFGLYGICEGMSGAGVYGSNNGGPGVAIVADGFNGMAGQFNGAVIVNGAFTVVGAKHAAVRHRDGSHRLLYSMESPESWFEDFGDGKVVRGKAEVKLARDFAAVVRAKSYHVFLTAHGDSNGLYVARRNPAGFVVREQKGGSSSLTFSYRIVAKRKDIEGKRLMKITIPKLPRPPKLPTSLRSPTTGASPKRKLAPHRARVSK